MIEQLLPSLDSARHQGGRIGCLELHRGELRWGDQAKAVRVIHVSNLRLGLTVR